MIAQHIGRYRNIVDTDQQAAEKIAHEMMANVDRIILHSNDTCYTDILNWYKETYPIQGRTFSK